MNTGARMGRGVSTDVTSGNVPVEIVVSALDRSFARLVVRLAGEHGMTDGAEQELLRCTALLVSAERADGNSCVELGEYAGQEVDLGGRVMRFPSLAEWQRLLLDSGVCTRASSDAADEAPTDGSSLFVLENERLYLSRYHRAESRLAVAIRRRAASVVAVDPTVSTARFRALFPSACDAATVDWQALAAVAALRSPLVFITGGPGTGKTTVAARLLALLLDRDPGLTIALAAPTGRAAARLSEAIGAAAVRDGLHELTQIAAATGGRTLHRLLGYHPATQRFRFHADRPLAEDVVVVDEASMVDVLMMDALFATLKPSARVLVLGDPDQLASVDTGFVLGDVTRAAQGDGRVGAVRYSAALIQAYATLSGVHGPALVHEDHPLPLQDVVIRLQVSWRFGRQVGIGRLAECTRLGRSDEVLGVLDDPACDDVALRDLPGTAAALLAPVQSQIERFLSVITPDDALGALAQFRILAALREGPSGVAGLNTLIESWLQRQGRFVAGWYDHRPILITANDPSTQLYNGDVGVVLAVGGVPMVHFPTPEGGVRSLSPSQLPMHETAWAMTVHKSQGSEFDHVLLVLPDVDSRVLTRELVYTGVTRARRSVTLFGDRRVLVAAIERSVARASGLVQRLRR